MPLYDYVCLECGHDFEKNLKIADREKPTNEACPNCGQFESVKQMIAKAPGIGDPVRLGIRQPDDTWKDFTRRLKKSNPGSDFTTW